MRIAKILNNNAIVIFEYGIEKIVIGKGIAFNKKPGDIVRDSAKEKEFILKDDTFSTDIQTLITNIPSNLFEAISQIIIEATKKLDKKLNDTLYLTLSDHITFAMERFEKNIELNNAIEWDIRRFYPVSYEMGMRALEIIAQKTGLELPNTEASFIALHFVNAAENYEDMSGTYQITHIINDTLNIIKEHAGEEIDEESLGYNRLITHLQFFAKRILFERKSGNQKEDMMLVQLQQTYPDEDMIVNHISEYILENYGVLITESERVYLIIHLTRIFT